MELRPQDSVINDHLGDAYWKVGRHHEARFQWRRALQFEPEADQVGLIEGKIERGLTEGPTTDPASSPADAARAPARAKVNLSLHVVGRRPDGLHLLDSLVVFADIGDALVVWPAADLTLAIDGPFAAAVPPGEDTLV